MHDHAAHGDAVVETESFTFIANLGFACGIIAVLLEATIKLSPLAFMIAIPGIVLCALGFVQGTIQSRPVKGAIAGLFCCLFTDHLLASRARRGQLGRRRARRLAQLAVLSGGRVLVTGAPGFVGGHLCAALGDAAVPSSADVTRSEPRCWPRSSRPHRRRWSIWRRSRRHRLARRPGLDLGR